MPARQWKRNAVVTLLIFTGIIYFLATKEWSTSLTLEDVMDGVDNHTLGFQELLVINLPDRTDRRDSMTLLAAVTDLKLTWIKGVRGDEVAEKSLPPGERNPTANWRGMTGCWRGHMNALQQVVERNLTSAVVMEDDLDWDVSLKSQLRLLSLASRAYLQPSARSGRPLAGRTSGATENSNDHDVFAAPRTLAPSTTPYGDGWDVLWLGHIGTELPMDWQHSGKNTGHAPRSLAVITIPHDDTVPAPKNLKRHPFADRRDHFADLYAPHTRLLHESRGTMGAQAYAITQRGARRLLRQFGVETFTDGWDAMLRDWCDGVYARDHSELRPTCLTVQPPLFSHYYARTGGSDIHGIGGGYMKKVGSPYIRRSVRLNLDALLRQGAQSVDGERLRDQWPDDDVGPW